MERCGRDGVLPETRFGNGGKTTPERAIALSIWAENCSTVTRPGLEAKVGNYWSQRASLLDRHQSLASVWAVHEQVCTAALDCGDLHTAQVASHYRSGFRKCHLCSINLQL